MRNWAGNHAYAAGALHEPRTVEELQEIVRRAAKCRVVGSRHSFNDVADTTGDLISLATMPHEIEIDGGSRCVTVGGGIRYGELCGPLNEAGLALHSLASLPHISVAGACATGTHGSGDRTTNLATAIRSLELVRADGEIVTLDRQHDPVAVDAAAVSLGALGVVTRLTLETEPAYEMRQDVYEDLSRDAFDRHFDEITALADSVSFFTEWRGPVIDQVWLKRRLLGTDDPALPGELFGATPATVDLHPIRRLPAEACTPQLGVPGPWHERVPHFRMDHTPSSGDELQTEYFVRRSDAVAAFRSLDRLRDRIAPLIQVSEIRTIAADGLWLSPAHDRPSVAFHFTWQPDWPSVRGLLPAIEAALTAFEPRPHWGKLFTIAPADVRGRYERLSDFVALARRLDPSGKFSNRFVDRFLFDVI